MTEEETKLNNQICKVCNSTDIRLYLEKDGYKIIRCLSCGSGFVDLLEAPVDSDLYQSYYTSYTQDYESSGYDDYLASEKALELTFQKKVNALLRYLETDSNKPLLVDIGCGPGFFLKVASKYFDGYGVDVSKQAVDYARDKLHLKVINSSFNPELFGHRKFDVVTLWDTIEHVDNPHILLEGVSQILVENGILSFTTGDIGSIVSLVTRKKWHLLTVPDHLFFFSKKGIKDLLKKNGFEIIHLSYPSYHFTLDYLCERMVKSLNVAHLYRTHHSLRSCLNRFIVPLNLFDIMFVVARKVRDC